MDFTRFFKCEEKASPSLNKKPEIKKKRGIWKFHIYSLTHAICITCPKTTKNIPNPLAISITWFLFAIKKRNFTYSDKEEILLFTN